jgi:hypothetical protein
MFPFIIEVLKGFIDNSTDKGALKDIEEYLMGEFEP